MSQVFDPRDIVTERPAVFDEQGNRLFLYPTAVKGYWKTWRTRAYWFLIFVFMVLPWTHWEGQQTILMDLPNRRFTFFGMTFWAHDTPYLFFPLMTAVFAVALITALFGRAWCGWACPQTVFIDAVYRKIEALIEGNASQQKKLAKQKWDIEKIWKRCAKWLFFTLVSLHISHSFFAYFVGAHELVWISQGSPLNNWGLFLMVQSFAALLLFDFGWFREQFCIIMCPYGRFQSVLMGSHSKAVMYDEARGEPRGKAKKGSDQSFGDCVNCYKCVAVCPTGVDIRNGIQLECIACTACIDACDEIMTKLGRPKGLIRYSSEAAMSGRPSRTWTPRVLAYSSIIAILILSFVFLVSNKDTLNLQVLRAIEAPYKLVVTSQGQRVIINHFRIHLNNHQLGELRLEGLEANTEAQIVAPTLPVIVPKDRDAWVHFFVKVEKGSSELFARPLKIIANFRDANGTAMQRELFVSLLGPTK
ncbi:MAG: cytochrome c oxidase accessory protein CcoG [Pseudomonadota bacterium]